jgi:hypothetical protein
MDAIRYARMSEEKVRGAIYVATRCASLLYAEKQRACVMRIMRAASDRRCWRGVHARMSQSLFLACQCCS